MLQSHRHSITLLFDRCSSVRTHFAARRTRHNTAVHMNTNAAALLSTILLLHAFYAHGDQSSAQKQTTFNAEQELDASTAFRKSQELGISRCSLPGMIQDHDVTLHMWMRMAPPKAVKQPCARDDQPKACGNTAKVRGFAILQDNKHPSVPQRGTAVHMVHSQALFDFNSSIFLRSAHTGMIYNLTVIIPTKSWGQRVFDDYRPEKTSSDLIDLVGDIILHPNDTNAMDFEWRVDGFNWHCQLLVTPPVLSRNIRQLASQSVTTSQGQVPPASLAAARFSDNLSWKHVDRASRTSKTEAWVILATYYGADVQRYERMLYYHIVWHQQYGVTKYILHVWEYIKELLSSPRIQDLIRRDILVVLLFDDLPRHEKVQFAPGYYDRYHMQVIQYNHASLALWGSDSLMLLVDLDEYLMTPKPISLVQVFDECSDRREVVSDLQLVRFGGACRLDVPEKLCNPMKPMKDPVWVQTNLDKLDDGTQPHPLTLATFRKELSTTHTNQKALLDPNTALGIHCHSAFRSGKSYGAKKLADHECARLIHLDNMNAVRHPYTSSDVMKATTNVTAWWWPAERILKRLPPKTDE